jgi:hypothetical protein
MLTSAGSHLAIPEAVAVEKALAEASAQTNGPYVFIAVPWASD